MSRYIDADALGIGKANRVVFENKAYADGWNAAIDIIESPMWRKWCDARTVNSAVNSFVGVIGTAAGSFGSPSPRMIFAAEDKGRRTNHENRIA